MPSFNIQLLTFLVTTLVISLAALLAFLITLLAIVRPEPGVAKLAINGLTKTLQALVVRMGHRTDDPQPPDESSPP